MTEISVLIKEVSSIIIMEVRMSVSPVNRSTVEPLIKATPDVGTPPLLRTLHYVPSVLYWYKFTPEIRDTPL